MYKVSTIFLPIFFDKNIPALAPGIIFHMKSFSWPPLMLVQHYSELIKFFWKRMHWKVGHTSHPHNHERSYGKFVNTQ